MPASGTLYPNLIAAIVPLNPTFLESKMKKKTKTFLAQAITIGVVVIVSAVWSDVLKPLLATVAMSHAPPSWVLWRLLFWFIGLVVYVLLSVVSIAALIEHGASPPTIPLIKSGDSNNEMKDN
jgi:MFS family permease